MLSSRDPGASDHAAETPHRLPTMAGSLRNWIIVVSVVLFVSFTGLFWALTGSAVAAVGIAGFATVWGGVGFGVMAAGAAQAMRDEHGARAATRR